MLRSLLELIQATANDAKAAKVVPDLNTDGRTAYVQVGSVIQQYPLPPEPRKHEVHSLVDLILYARREEHTSPVVWHGRNGIVLLLDDDDRRDTVVFPLTHSSRFETLQQLAAEKPVLDHAKFIKLLRIDLGLDNVAVVSKFRKLDWQLNKDGGSDIRHGADKMGKSIMAKVQGIDELPDELDVEVPVYQQTGERRTYTVKCAIEIDTINERLQLIPVADELERVIDLAQASIHDRLAAALDDKEVDGSLKIPVYYGEP